MRQAQSRKPPLCTYTCTVHTLTGLGLCTKYAIISISGNNVFSEHVRATGSCILFSQGNVCVCIPSVNGFAVSSTNDFYKVRFKMATLCTRISLLLFYAVSKVITCNNSSCGGEPGDETTLDYVHLHVIFVSRQVKCAHK